jgi:shikimate 5-dehydrogenase
MGSRTLTQKQFLTVMQVSDVVLNSFSYFFFLSNPQAPSFQGVLFCSSIHSRPKLGITYFYESFSTGTEELVTAIATMHNITRRGDNTNLTVPIGGY